MPFVKGRRKTGGRQKGVSNVDNRDIKEAFRNLVEMNLENMTFWLAQIAADSPYRAMEIILDMSERFVPKLSRTELAGDPDQPLAIQFYLPQRETMETLSEAGSRLIE